MRQFKTEKALTVLTNYPTFYNLSKAFSPNMGAALLANVDKAYSDNSPTLRIISEAYGGDSAIIWIKTQVLAIDFYNGAKKEGDEAAIIEFSKLIVRGYPNIKLTEFALFAARFKLGQYGKFYGGFDPITLGEAFRKFLDYRTMELDKLEKQRTQSEIEARRAVIPDGYTSLSWYQELKERANNGDSFAIDQLKPPMQ